MSNAARMTDLVVNSKTTAMIQLHGMLENDAISTRGQFSDMMAAAFKYGDLDYKALASDLGYSASSVYRWVEGRSAPHRSQFSTVQDWVIAALDRETDLGAFASRPGAVIASNAN